MTAAGSVAALDLVVPGALAGARVDRVVALLAGVSRQAAAELVAAGRVHLDGLPVSSRSRPVGEGQHLQVQPRRAPTDAPVPDPTVAFGVVHEDAELVVVDKPAGLVVHHGAGRRAGTLVDGLAARYPELTVDPALWPDSGRPGIVHRLDKGTSGLLVVARTPEAFRCLSRQLRVRSAGRDYVALVAGTLDADAGVVDAPIGRSARQPTRMAVTVRGRAARTEYRARARFRRPLAATLVDVRLDTGRTHQVRVHLAAIGHPVVGDPRYGGLPARPEELTALLGPGRLFLHAARLELEHPAGGRMTFNSPLPPDLEQVLSGLEA